jgi:alginate O-acetyltransferase complex protein AlgI
MLFSSIPFLYYFLPIVLIIYFIVPWKLKNFVLLASSLIFYGWGEPKYVFLMIASIILFFGCGLLIEKAKSQSWKKVWLGTALVISIALLGVFKYADFFIENFNAATGLNMSLLKLALPIGISFYTFQCLSYAIDVYRGTVGAQKNIINFGAYVSLFPQLIAGPIVRYVDVAKELDHRKHSLEGFTLGLRRFVIGLAKKILIANQLGELTNIFRMSDEKSIVFYWMYAIAFALHIYFDFSGYSDMAIGLGKIFGFNFIENFNYPYMSKSIGEFWRRWHMSLGSWFRDYVYIPLGGNRVGKMRWLFNTLVVWMLTGLWHGAAWTFILWGLLYALFLLIEKWIPAIKKLPNILKHTYTLLIVMLGFVLFNAVNMTQALGDIGGMFGFARVPFCNRETIYYLSSYGVLLVLGIIGATPLIKTTVVKLTENRHTEKIMQVVEPIVLLVLIVICSAYLVDGSFNPFLYFRF